MNHAEEIAVLTFPVEIRHTHCSGAALSAGLLYRLRAEWTMECSMEVGAASGALRCAQRQSETLPGLDQLQRPASGTAGYGSSATVTSYAMIAQCSDNRRLGPETWA